MDENEEIKSSISLYSIFHIALAFYLSYFLYGKIGLIGIILGFIAGLLPIVGPSVWLYFTFFYH